MLPKPSGKPQDPRNESQQDGGPLICPPVYPGIGAIDKAKFRMGKFASKTIKAGK